jgi:hypothetical protein
MRKSILFGAPLVACLLMAVILLLRPRPTEPQSPAGSESLTPAASVTPANTIPVAATRVVAANRPSAIVSPTAVAPVSGAGGSAAMLRIKAGQVLAAVNGVPIELKDLLPLPAGKETSDQTMPADRYAFLLERAVDREVTLQNARAQRVDLTESQREQLAKLRARSELPAANLFDDLQHNPANAEFEARDAAALLLQASLAEKAGVPSRDVTAAQVGQYYQQHRSEYAALPPDAAQRQAPWEQIEQGIRVRLARQAQTLHDEAFQKYFDQLRASAQIVKTRPTS